MSKQKPLCIIYADNATFQKPDVQRFIAGLRDEGKGNVRVCVRNPEYYISKDREPAESVYVQIEYMGKGIVTDYDADPRTEAIEILEEVMPKFFAYQDERARCLTNPFLDPDYAARIEEALGSLHTSSNASHPAIAIGTGTDSEATGLIGARQLAPGEMLTSAAMPEGAMAIEVPADGLTREVTVDSTGGHQLAPADGDTITRIVTTTLDPSGEFATGQTSTLDSHGKSADEVPSFDCGQEGHTHADAEEVQACKDYYAQADHSASNTPATSPAPPAETPLGDSKPEAPGARRSGGSRQRNR
jgi:hypothetical protein